MTLDYEKPTSTLVRVVFGWEDCAVFEENVSGIDGAVVGGRSAVVECCFCGTAISEEELDLVTIIVVGVPRQGRKQARSQQLWCHARCLGTRLHQSAVFDTGSFEAADTATVDAEDRSEESACARAADDGWPSRDDEQYGPR